MTPCDFLQYLTGILFFEAMHQYISQGFALLFTARRVTTAIISAVLLRPQLRRTIRWTLGHTFDRVRKCRFIATDWVERIMEDRGGCIYGTTSLYMTSSEQTGTNRCQCQASQSRSRELRPGYCRVGRQSSFEEARRRASLDSYTIVLT